MKNKLHLTLLRTIVIGSAAFLALAAQAQTTSLTIDLNGPNPFQNPTPPALVAIDSGNYGWGSLAVPTQIDPAGANNSAMWSQSTTADNGSHIALAGLRDPTHSYGMDIDGAGNLSIEVNTFFKFDFSSSISAYRANFILANCPVYPPLSQGGPLAALEGQVRMFSAGDWGLSAGSTDVHLANPLSEDTWYRTDLKLTYVDDNDLAVSFQLFDLSGDLLGSLDSASSPLGQSKGCWYALWQDNTYGVGGTGPDGTSTTYFDDVTLTGAPNSIVEVPEPGSFKLAASMGLLGFGFYRRTRRTPAQQRS